MAVSEASENAYESPEGFHRHKCRFCGWVWEHDDRLDDQHGSAGAHECFQCGRCNWGMGIYNGPEKPYRQAAVEPR